MKATVLRGVLGWGNRKSGVEAYGPDGRWGQGREGDLLGDALEREGATEGATLLVIAVPRFGDYEPLFSEVEAMLTEREVADVRHQPKAAHSASSRPGGRADD